MTEDSWNMFAAPRCLRAEELGAYLLGGLDDAAALDLRVHADGCAVCAEELHQLRPVMDALGALPADLDMVHEALPVELGDRLLARAAADQRRRRLTRSVLSAAAACVLVIGSVGLTRLTTGGSGPGQQRLGERIALVAAIPGASAFAFLDERPSGTYMELQAEGLPAGRYRMWFKLGDGTRIPMGTFRSSGDGTLLRCPGSSDLSRTDVVGVGATDEAGNDVLSASLTTVGIATPY